MSKFLQGKALNDSVYDIIYEAKKILVIMSPFIKLDEYFKNELFEKHRSNAELKIYLAFGKNTENVTKSFKREDFDYFKDFPNIYIVHIPNLHAKYYANEEKGLITSINLYDYSFKNNIEYGVLFESGFITNEKVDREAWDFTYDLIKDNYLIFARVPSFKKKLLGKDYLGSETKFDVIEELVQNGSVEKKSIVDYSDDRIFRFFEKKAARLTREEFEKAEIHDKKIVKEKAIRNNYQQRDYPSGHCIRCGKAIPLDPFHPYCRSCYYSWAEYSNEYYTEKFCHNCGKRADTTILNPVCKNCCF